MVNQTSTTIAALTAPIRTICGQVKHYRSNTLIGTYDRTDYLKSFEVQRTYENSKFFGMVANQKLSVKLLDTNRAITIQSGDKLETIVNVQGESATANFPFFYVTEVNRDETTNEISVTAYDSVSKLKAITFAVIKYYFDENTSGSYSMSDVSSLIGEKIGLNVEWRNLNSGDTRHTTQYTSGANYDGSETLLEVLEDIAEAMQCVCFVTQTKLVFKAIRYTDTVDLAISRAQELDIDAKENRRLIGICSATELGDNVTSALSISGTTQYMYDNGFLELRSDLDTYLDTSLSYIAGTAGYSIAQYELRWRGWIGLELGDKISFVCKDNSVASSYVFDDTLTYDGALSESTQFTFSEQEDTESNPSSLGDVLNRTLARVDKQEQQITLLATQTDANEEHLAQIQLDVNTITANVNQIQTNTEDSIDSLEESVTTLANSVAAKVDASQVSVIVSETLADGVDSVQTSTGFTFDKDGLTISKSDSPMETVIDEDGMTISRDETEVLTVNNTGVIAENIKLSKYLIIGKFSRIEDWNDDSTAVFWIGEVDE